MFSLYLRKGASLSLKMEGLKRNPNILGLLNFSYFTTLAHTLLSSIFSHNFLLFIKPSRKTLRFYHFFRSSFPMKASVSYKIYIIYIYALLLLISLLLVQYTRPQAENLRWVEGKMFFCLYLKFLNYFSVLLPSPWCEMSHLILTKFQSVLMHTCMCVWQGKGTSERDYFWILYYLPFIILFLNHTTLILKQPFSVFLKSYRKSCCYLFQNHVGCFYILLFHGNFWTNLSSSFKNILLGFVWDNI